jgi:hypothetical protein
MMTRVALLLTGLLLALSPIRAAAAELPTDLDRVPRHAAAFVHIQTAELWRSPWSKDLRHLVEQAGPEAWKTFVDKSPLNPATVDRVTFILVTPQTLGDPFPTADPEATSVLSLVHVTQPFDRPRLIEALGPREKVYRQHLYYFNEEHWTGLALLDEMTFLFGSEEALVQYFELARQQDTGGPLQAALEAAAKNQVTLGFNPTLLGKQKGAESLPPPLRELLKAHCGLLTLNLDATLRLDVRFDYATAEQAADGEKALGGTRDLALQGLAQPIAELEKQLKDPSKTAAADMPINFSMVVGLGFLRELENVLKKAPIERQGLTVRGRIAYRQLESWQMLVVSLAAVITLGQNASGTFSFVSERVSSTPGKDPVEEHLRTLSQALERYHEKHGRYPPPAIYDKDGRPILSWRVALLPYLGEEGLYSEFKLDEPWDSLHNKRLLKKLPKAFQSPSGRSYWGPGRWKTVTQIITGENTVFEGTKGIARTDVTRPAILLAHLTSNDGVYWTKPADLDYAADQPPNLFGKPSNKAMGPGGVRVQVLMTDGTYRTIDKSVGEKELRALIERSAKKPERKAKAKADDLDAMWQDFLRIDDAGTHKARQDMVAMIHVPEKAVPFLKLHVKPVPRPDAKQIAQWLADLDSRSFKTRDKALGHLEEQGELATAAIDRKLAEKNLSADVRRSLEGLARRPKTVLSGAELRTVRAIEVLERVGTPEARAVLDELAGGGEGTVITEEARKAVAMLGRHTGGK